MTYGNDGPIFKGQLQAYGLKPNFAYNLKLEGILGTASNELIGLAGAGSRRSGAEIPGRIAKTSKPRG